MTTITIDRALLEQTLQALESAEDHLAKPYSTDASKAITALYTAPPQQAEPVAWRYKYSDGFWRFSNGARVNSCDPIESQALYTAPPQRKPLTDEEIGAMWRDAASEEGFTTAQFVRNFARAIERAHGIEEKK